MNSDYESESHSLFANIVYHPTDKLSVWVNQNLAKSKAGLEPVEMPDPEESIEYLDYTFVDMHGYSDLDYTFYVGKLGVSYLVAPGWRWSADASLYDLNDDAGGWVYGDEGGSFYVLRTGVQIEVF